MTTTVDLERIKEKIKALKRLATNEAASVGEVGNAIQLAKNLCSQYNLILSEIDENEQVKELKENIIEVRAKVEHHRINACRSMNAAICRLYEVETFFDYAEENQTLIGLKSDIELAQYAIGVAHSALNLGWKNYMRSEDYEDYIANGYKRNQIRRDYSKGFAIKVIELVKAMEKDKEALKEVQTSKCTALILRKEAEIEGYKNSNYPNLRTSRSRISMSLRGAVEAGKADGSRVRFNQALNSSLGESRLAIGKY